VSAILACAFPAFVALALLVLLPIRIPDHLAVSGDQRGSDPTRDTSPLSSRQHLAYAVPYLLGSFGLAYPLGVAQRALFEIAGRDTSSFSHRATEIPIYPFLPALFVGLVVGFPIYFRVLRWYLGPRLLDFLDRPDRSRIPVSLRQEIQIFSGIAWAVAILATFLNLAAFDTFLQITGGELRYSTFFSPITHQHSIGEVQELAIYSRRIAPSGSIVDKGFLEVRLRGGGSVDTFYLIEPEHIPQVVAAFERNPAFRGRVTRIDGYK